MRIYAPADAADDGRRTQPANHDPRRRPNEVRAADRAEELAEVVNAVQTAFFLTVRQGRKAA